MKNYPLWEQTPNTLEDLEEKLSLIKKNLSRDMKI